MARPVPTIDRTLVAGRNAIVYCTTKTIQNPIGDGRSNKADFRSSLEKNTIPAGFVFAIDEDGNIEDRSRPFKIVKGEQAVLLREALGAVAGDPLKGPPPAPPEETVEDVLASLQGPDATALVLKALGLTGPQLRALLQAGAAGGQTKDSDSSPPHLAQVSRQ